MKLRFSTILFFVSLVIIAIFLVAPRCANFPEYNYNAHVASQTITAPAAVRPVATVQPVQPVASTTNSEPLYLLTLKFKKSSFTLDLMQHAKNAMQAVEIVIPVDREFYEQQSVGHQLQSQFRGWSLLSTGEISSYTVTVQKKEIKSRN